MLRKLWKISWISALSLIGFFVIVGILVNIFVPEEELKKESIPEPTKTTVKPPAPQAPSSEKEVAIGESEEAPEIPQPPPPPKSEFEQMAAMAVGGIHATMLLEKYSNNEFAADEKYKGEIVLVRGEIHRFSDTVWGPQIEFVKSQYSFVTLACRMRESQKPLLAKLSLGQDVLVVGELTGFSSGRLLQMKNCLVTLPE